MNCLSIAVTSYNNLSLRGVASLERTLDSIRTAREVLRGEAPIRVALVWVDDGSDDGTAQWLGARLRESRDEWFCHNEVNHFIGFARNQAAARIASDIVVPFDSDDEMYPEHLLVGWRALNTVDPSGRRPAWVSTRCDFGGCGEIHPEWAERVALTIPSTKFVLRRVWDFVEGWPDSRLYRTTWGVDIDFDAVVGTFFVVCPVENCTVRYWHYPGSKLDRQLARFKLPPSEQVEDLPEAATPDDHRLRERMLHFHIGYLKYKLERLTDPQGFDDLVTNFAFVDDGASGGD